MPDGPALEGERPGTRLLQPAQGTQERGLPRAVVPDEPDDLAGGEPQGDVIEHGAVAEGHRQARHLDSGRLAVGDGGTRLAPGRLRQIKGPQPHGVPPLRGQRPELVRGVVAGHRPGVEHDVAVRQVREVAEAVLTDQQGLAPRPQLAKQLRQTDGRLVVEVRRGLVQHEDLRSQGVGPGDRHLLLLPAGHLKDAPARERPDTHLVNGLLHPVPQRGVGDPGVLEPERDLAVGVEVEELRLGVLEDRSHEARDLVPLQGRDITTADCDGAAGLVLLVPGQEAVDEAGQRALPAAAAAGEDHELPGSDPKGDVLKRPGGCGGIAE